MCSRAWATGPAGRGTACPGSTSRESSWRSARRTRFLPGDEVFGLSRRRYRGVREAAENALAPRPAGLTFERRPPSRRRPAPRCTGSATPASSRPVSGPRQRRLGRRRNVRRSRSPRPWAPRSPRVANTRNVEVLRSIGADHVIDYTREDFTTHGARFDLILDNIENRSLSTCGERGPDGTSSRTVAGALGGTAGCPPDQADPASPSSRQTLAGPSTRTWWSELADSRRREARRCRQRVPVA